MLIWWTVWSWPLTRVRGAHDAACVKSAHVAGDTRLPNPKPDCAPGVAPDTAPDAAHDAAPGAAPGVAPDTALDAAPDAAPGVAGVRLIFHQMTWPWSITHYAPLLWYLSHLIKYTVYECVTINKRYSIYLICITILILIVWCLF